MTDQDLEALKTLVVEASGSFEPIPSGRSPSLASFEDIRGVVFDVYGTLLISKAGDIGMASEDARDEYIVEAMDKTGLTFDGPPDGLHQLIVEKIQQCQELEKEKKPELEYPEVEIREVWQQFLQELIAENRLAGDITLRKVAEIALRYELSTNPAALMPHFQEVMEYLRERNLPIAIISNAQFFTPLVMEALLGSTLKEAGFDLYASVWSYLEREAKPSTALYEKAAQKWDSGYKIEPKKLLYIGNDMRNDIAPASHCHFKTALFAGDKRSLRLREEDPLCKGVEPDAVLTDLSQIKDLLAT